MKRGFTLIELLVVIAIIAVLVAVVYVTLNPLVRFQDSRDATRKEEVFMIANAIKLDQVDHGGRYLDVIDNLVNGNVYMITDGPITSGCAASNTHCLTTVSGDASCVDLETLVSRGYLGSVPISKNGEGGWSSNFTGYTLEKDANGVITVRACEAENTSEIKLAR